MLEFELKHRKNMDNIMPKVLNLGLPIPEVFKNPPTMVEHLRVFYDAFLDLQTCRHSGGPIPWTTVMAYGDRFGFTADQTEDLWYYVSALDEVWAQHQREQG